MKKSITIIGAGSWWTSLAQVLADTGRPAVLFCLDEKEADLINHSHTNPSYLKDCHLPDLVTATTDMKQALTSADTVVIAVPSPAFVEVLAQLQPYFHHHLIIATKGLFAAPDFLFSSQVEKILQADFYAFLSGPSHAEDVIQRMPTWVTFSSPNLSHAQELWKLFETDYFHCEYSTDIVGVQIAGALKNLVAFLCGVSDGLGKGGNQKAVIITKGIQEIKKLISKYGGESETLLGISGLGDVIVTSLSPFSRNRRAGKYMAQGYSKSQIVEELMKMVVESFNVIEALPFILGENAEEEYPLLSQALAIGRGKTWNCSLKL